MITAFGDPFALLNLQRALEIATDWLQALTSDRGTFPPKRVSTGEDLLRYKNRLEMHAKDNQDERLTGPRRRRQAIMILIDKIKQWDARALLTREAPFVKAVLQFSSGPSFRKGGYGHEAVRKAIQIRDTITGCFCAGC